MPVRKKKPTATRKVLVRVLQAARFEGVQIDIGPRAAHLPRTEDDVRHFIVSRTRWWREVKIIQPILTLLAKLDQDDLP